MAQLRYSSHSVWPPYILTRQPRRFLLIINSNLSLAIYLILSSTYYGRYKLLPSHFHHMNTQSSPYDLMYIFIFVTRDAKAHDESATFCCVCYNVRVAVGETQYNEPWGTQQESSLKQC